MIAVDKAIHKGLTLLLLICIELEMEVGTCRESYITALSQMIPPGDVITYRNGAAPLAEVEVYSYMSRVI